MTIRVQVSCWCWAQARGIRNVLPQFTPAIEDWWEESPDECDRIDQILADGAEPMIDMFFDVDTGQEAQEIERVAAIELLTISSRTFTPVVRMEGDVDQ